MVIFGSQLPSLLNCHAEARENLCVSHWSMRCCSPFAEIVGSIRQSCFFLQGTGAPLRATHSARRTPSALRTRGPRRHKEGRKRPRRACVSCTSTTQAPIHARANHAGPPHPNPPHPSATTMLCQANHSCGVVCCGVTWSGVVWRSVVWCGVVWCGVVRIQNGSFWIMAA